MKKFFVVAFVILTCISGNRAQAMDHSTQENFNTVFKICYSAINITADYATLINNRNYDVVVIRLQDCTTLENSLGSFWENGGAQGAESLDLMLSTRILLQERGLTLSYYIDAVNAYQSNNIALYKECLRKMYGYCKSAEQLRQEIRNKYGY